MYIIDKKDNIKLGLAINVFMVYLMISRAFFEYKNHIESLKAPANSIFSKDSRVHYSSTFAPNKFYGFIPFEIIVPITAVFIVLTIVFTVTMIKSKRQSGVNLSIFFIYSATVEIIDAIINHSSYILDFQTVICLLSLVISIFIILYFKSPNSSLKIACTVLCALCAVLSVGSYIGESIIMVLILIQVNNSFSFNKVFNDKATTPDIEDDNKIVLNNVELLLKYKQLLDDGIITQEEFDEKKKELL